ncbi:MAG: hypothetical protein RBT16_05670, partial [Desulfococcus multivorans]|nr:hypothetical protein [Desulfococcus multivorans]
IRDEIELDEWVVMPNHFHGIIVIADGRGDRRVAPMGCTTVLGEQGDPPVAPTLIVPAVLCVKSAKMTLLPVARAVSGSCAGARNRRTGIFQKNLIIGLKEISLGHCHTYRIDFAQWRFCHVGDRPGYCAQEPLAATG